MGNYRTFLVASGIGAGGMLDKGYAFDGTLGLTTTSTANRDGKRYGVL
ncbi:MAG TPA: hypothetical protein VNY05_41790 [Candidatus Acidoferrales bacterium]|nr:hypothetical protein [Candidatus Acidoferrales bacterium]